ncbi:C-type lectin domain family 4 member F-like isoform X2 [Heliangelus exortis]|uniref:C-type lectin domain family 4 member F-like isoform X2 n=1 Tax=Heliangelus exortis TaxID=472823 RepID=UPI003A95B6FD
MGTGVLLLLLGTPLVTLLILHLQGQAELRAVRAQLEAAGTPLLLDPHAAQIRKDQLGRWLQGLGLGWRYHRGTLYFFSRDHKDWGDAERACRAWHCHLASVTSPEEQFLGAVGSRTAVTTVPGDRRCVPRSTRWATGSGTTTTATSPSPGSARGS